MFRNMRAKLYADMMLTDSVGEIDIDLQPYIKCTKFFDGTSIDSTHRIFCDICECFDYADYIRISGDVFKIIKVVRRGDILEVLVYKRSREGRVT